jgi:hypothetical protein
LIEKQIVLAMFAPWMERKEVDHLPFIDKAFMAWYKGMVEVTEQQCKFPTKLVNHYVKWLNIEATRDSSYAKTIMEGEGG